MTKIIDRRGNQDKKKNLKNRKKFIDRVKGQVKKSVDDSIRDGKIEDLAKGNNVRVKVKNTKEPTFNQDFNTGSNTDVMPGNRHFNKGDTIDKPKQGGGKKGNKAGQGDDDTDDFQFVLTREEFMNILFEDLALPDLVKQNLKQIKTLKMERQGLKKDGNPSQIDLVRTSKNSIGRRIALKRPSKKKIAELELQLEQETDATVRLELEEKIAKLKKKQAAIPYYDPLDLQYRRFNKIEKPVTHAVMFAVMDVSGSMGEFEKDIAKRFFLLLYLFLSTKYESIEIRFIRHTTTAEEVDENTFFYDPRSGGTMVSSSLELVDSIIKKEYNIDEVNIFMSYAGDSDNWYDDNKDCNKILRESLLDKLQYFAYIEIKRPSFWGFPVSEDEHDTLWRLMSHLSNEFPKVQCRKIFDKNEIYGVFKELFKKRDKK